MIHFAGEFVFRKINGNDTTVRSAHYFMDDHTRELLIGYGCAIAAALCWGTQGIFVKVPSVVKAECDPIVFQCFYSFSIFVTSWLFLVIGPFQWTWYGVAGAALWVPTNMMAIVAIGLSGLAVAQGVWSGSISKSS